MRTFVPVFSNGITIPVPTGWFVDQSATNELYIHDAKDEEAVKFSIDQDGLKKNCIRYGVSRYQTMSPRRYGVRNNTGKVLFWLINLQ